MWGEIADDNYTSSHCSWSLHVTVIPLHSEGQTVRSAVQSVKANVLICIFHAGCVYWEICNSSTEAALLLLLLLLLLFGTRYRYQRNENIVSHVVVLPPREEYGGVTVSDSLLMFTLRCRVLSLCLTVY